MIGAALARAAIEEPMTVERFAQMEGGDVPAPQKEITPRLVREIRYFCNHVCDEKVRAGCSVYGNGRALKECLRVKRNEPALRQRAGC